MTRLSLSILVVAGFCAPAAAQPVLFDFDNAPLHTSLPIDLTVGGLTAHFSATGQNFSIQRADTMGFTPAGFGGYCIYPNSVFPADLHVGFSRALCDFSILTAIQEYNCDPTGTMRVTAYMNGTFVATSTAAGQEGTWPTVALSLSAPAGFNSVVVHYDAAPPGCGDWGPIFLADNMTMTGLATCPADVDGNGDVGVADMLALLSDWGACPGCAADLDGDGSVGITDFLSLLAAWGPCP